MQMDYQIKFEDRRDYIHATVTGNNSRENVLAYMEDVLQECERRGCLRVLINECLEGPRFDTMQVFDVVAEGSMRALGRLEAFAYVDAQMGSMSEFAETVAVNRGVPVAMFNNMSDAEQWLQNQHPGNDEQYIFWAGSSDQG